MCSSDLKKDQPPIKLATMNYKTQGVGNVFWTQLYECVLAERRGRGLQIPLPTTAFGWLAVFMGLADVTVQVP